tara:strand:- start:6371 stop:6511 length:141 start_codon:yes stop_codon:yes gene_type:complete
MYSVLCTEPADVYGAVRAEGEGYAVGLLDLVQQAFPVFRQVVGVWG